ncbi:MAG: hypothetical protein WCB11_01300 [Terriglobales bacterium]
MTLVKKAAVGGNIADGKIGATEERDSLAQLGLPLIFPETHPVGLPESSREINRVNIRQPRTFAEGWRTRWFGFESFDNVRYTSWHMSAWREDAANGQEFRG